MGKYLQQIKLWGEKGVKGIALLTALFLLSSLTASAQEQQFFYKSKDCFTCNWSAQSTWVRSLTADGIYVSTDIPPTVENSIKVLISNLSEVTISDPRSIDQLVVDGTLIIEPNNFLTITHDQVATESDLMIRGLLINYGTITLNDEDGATAEVTGTVNNSFAINFSDPVSFTFKAGSTYDHKATEAFVPVPYVTWEDNSTIKITGLTSGSSLSAGLDQDFSNFIWDTPNLTGTSTITLNNMLPNVRGNFIVRSTGSSNRPLLLSKNLEVAGNLLIEGPGYLRLSAGGTAVPNRTVAVNGNVEVTAGTLNLNGGTTGITNLNVSGAFKYIGGTIIKSNGSTANINLEGTTNQLATINKNFTGAINFSVATGSVLDLGETSFIGTTIPATSKFTVQNGGTVKIGDADGINTSTGNIRIPQTYVAGSTIVFNGTDAQVLGAQFPETSTAIAESVSINLEINNANGVTMDKDLTIAADRTLTLTEGSLNIGENILTINGDVAGSASLGTNFASNLIINGSGALDTLNFTSAIEGLNNAILLNDLTINRSDAGTVTIGAPNAVAIVGKLDLAEGTLIVKDKLLGLYGSAVHTNGALSGNAETVIAVGVVPQDFGIPSASLQPVGNIDLNFSAAGDTINALTLGTLATGVNLGSDLNITETLTLQEGSLKRSDSEILTLADSSTVYLTNGKIDFEPVAATNGAYNLFYYGATASPGNEFTANASIRDLTIGGEDNRSEFTLSGERTIKGNLTVFNGDFTQNYPLSVTGNFTITKGNYDQKAELNLEGNLTSTVVGTFTSSISPVIMAGNMPQTIAGEFTFQNLTIDNKGSEEQPGDEEEQPGDEGEETGDEEELPNGIIANSNEVLLNNDINVEKGLKFSSGIMRTGGNRVLLGNTASVTGETDASHLLGNIQITKDFSISETEYTEDFGNIGIEMSPEVGTNPGTITVNRNTGTPITAAAGLPSISRVFDITGPTSGQDIAMTLKYLDSELNGNDESTLTMYKSTEPSTWVRQEEQAPAIVYTRDSDLNKVTLTGVTGFSRWTMASPIAVLPVELTYFTAKKKDHAVELNWETGLEIDNKGFEIQVSTDAVNYRKIGFVSSKNGNSRNAQKYTFTDTGIRNNSGTFYYRLRQVENNGEEKFYGPKSVSFDQAALAVNAYPNPSSGAVRVEFEAEANKEVTIMVIDIHGKTILSKQVETNRGLNTLEIDLGNQSNGVYILSIISNSGKQQIKLIKK